MGWSDICNSALPSSWIENFRNFVSRNLLLAIGLGTFLLLRSRKGSKLGMGTRNQDSSRVFEVFLIVLNGVQGESLWGGESRARNNTHKRKRKAERPTRCVALQLSHPRPRGTRRRERTCVVRAHQAGAKTIKVWRCCRTNRPGPSNAVPQISSTIHKRAAASNAAASTASSSHRRCHGTAARLQGGRTLRERSAGRALQAGAIEKGPHIPSKLHQHRPHQPLSQTGCTRIKEVLSRAHQV